MEEPLGRYFQDWSPYYWAIQCNKKTPFLFAQSDRAGMRKPKKDKYQHQYIVKRINIS